MIKRFLLILILFCPLIKTQAGNGIFSDSCWYIKPYINNAIILKHSKSLGRLVQGYPLTCELNIVKPTSGSHLWHHENNFPEIGINLSFVSYANPTTLGYGIIAAPFTEIPLNNNHSASRIYLRLCWGAAYITKPFDLYKNQKNLAIGTHLNAYIQFKFFTQHQITKNLRLEPGIMLSHVSNAAAQLPNLGLNIIGIGLGVNFGTAKLQKHLSATDSSNVCRYKKEIVITESFGFNQGWIMEKKKSLSCLSLLFNLNKRNTHKFGAGADIFYEKSYLHYQELNGNSNPTFSDKVRAGLKLSYSYSLGRLNFPIEMGAYVHQRYNQNGFIYHRLGVRYYGSKGIVVAFGMKSHWSKAYNLDLGIGYRWYVKK